MSDRPSHSIASASSVTEYLEEDHRRLDALLEEAIAFNGRAACDEAKAPFSEFASGLNRHIEVEEQVVFPTFEKLARTTSGPTVVMRAEHVQIRSALARISESLDARNASDAKNAFAELLEILSSHNMKEEAILYPMTDRLVGGPHERHQLVERLIAF